MLRVSVICDGDYAVLRIVAFPEQKSQMWCSEAMWKSWPPLHALRPSRPCFQREMCGPWWATTIHVTSTLRRHRSFWWSLWFWVTSLPLQPMTNTSLARTCESWWLQPVSLLARFRDAGYTCVRIIHSSAALYYDARELVCKVYLCCTMFFFFLRSNPSLGFYLSSLA